MGIAAPALGGMLGGGAGLAAMLMRGRKKPGQGQGQQGAPPQMGGVMGQIASGLMGGMTPPEAPLTNPQVPLAGIPEQLAGATPGWEGGLGYAPQIMPEAPLANSPLQDLAFMPQEQQPILMDGGGSEVPQQQPFGQLGQMLQNQRLRRRRQ